MWGHSDSLRLARLRLAVAWQARQVDPVPFQTWSSRKADTLAGLLDGHPGSLPVALAWGPRIRHWVTLGPRMNWIGNRNGDGLHVPRWSRDSRRRHHRQLERWRGRQRSARQRSWTPALGPRCTGSDTGMLAPGPARRPPGRARLLAGMVADSDDAGPQSAPRHRDRDAALAAAVAQDSGGGAALYNRGIAQAVTRLSFCGCWPCVTAPGRHGPSGNRDSLAGLKSRKPLLVAINKHEQIQSAWAARPNWTRTGMPRPGPGWLSSSQSLKTWSCLRLWS